MKPIEMMDDAQWQMLVRDVGDNFDDLTLKRGFNYYKQGRVRKLDVLPPQSIEAIVEGSDRYRVEIDLVFFAVSRCGCPVRAYCKHMIAVLLEYADRQGRPVHAIVNARSAAMLQKPAPKPTARATAGRNAEAARLKELADRIPNMSVPEWHELFDRIAAPFEQSVRDTRYSANALAAIRATKPSLSPVAEQLFQLNACLYVLEKLVLPAQGQWHGFSSFMGYHTEVAVSELKDKIRRHLEAGPNLLAEPENASRVSGTLAHLRRNMVTEGKAQPYFEDLYEQIWNLGLVPSMDGCDLFREELGHLEAAEQELGAALDRVPWLAARSRMLFRLSDDEAALSLLKEAAGRSGLRTDTLLHNLRDLSQAGEGERLVVWLVELGPLLCSYRHEGMDDYAAYWDKAIERIPDAEEQMWDTLSRMLPYSRSIYERQLLSRGRWRRWIDYQLSGGREPLDYRATDLAPIEKQSPETLLPFYHQAVERYVLQKNRDSYKAAVRLLKRLARLYKKLKQESRWELFFAEFASRHSRLRALHEELRKGKLLP